MSALDAYIAALPEERRTELSDDPGVAAALDRILEAGIGVAEEGERARLAAHLGRVVGVWLPDALALASVPAADLALAWRAARGDPGAVEALCAAHEDDLVAAMRSTGLDAATAREVWNTSLIELTVPTGGQLGGLATYGGRGSLRGWLRAVVVRKAMRAQRIDARAGDADLDAVTDLVDDPELQALRHRYRPQVEEAVRAAFDVLTPRQRTLLRQHHLDGLSIDKLGALYQVHRATAARWLNAASAAVLATCRQILRERLRISADEVDSLVRLVMSQVHVSVARHLGADGRERDPGEP